MKQVFNLNLQFYLVSEQQADWTTLTSNTLLGSARSSTKAACLDTQYVGVEELPCATMIVLPAPTLACVKC
jgi:hypothetical protein